MTDLPAPCPCHSLQTYASCCAPFHNGVQLPGEARLLMRSRYSAYALGLATYLRATLDEAHEDAAMDVSKFDEMIGTAAKVVSYTSLSVLYGEDTPNGREGDAEVLFIAGLREAGSEVGFAELSFFSKKDNRYFYKSGILVPSARLPAAPSTLTRAMFLALAQPHAASLK